MLEMEDPVSGCRRGTMASTTALRLGRGRQCPRVGGYPRVLKILRWTSRGVKEREVVRDGGQLGPPLHEACKQQKEPDDWMHLVIIFL